MYIKNCKINTLAFTSEPLFSACFVVCCSLKIYISVCSFIYKGTIPSCRGTIY
jgi:hypothetical protein